MPSKKLKSSKTKKIQVDSERQRSVEQIKDDLAFEEFEDESEFNDDHAFEEFEDKKNSSRSAKVEGRSNEQFEDNHVFEEFKDKSEFNDDHASKSWETKTKSTASQRSDQVWKLGLIFIYKSEVAGRRSGNEIGTDLHLLQVRGPQADWVWKFRQDQLPKKAVRISQLYEAKS